MRTLLVVFLDPPVEIGLQLLQHLIDLLPKRHAIELDHHRLVEPFTNPVGPQVPGLGPRVIDVLHRQVQFVLMAFWHPAVLRAAIFEDPIQQNLVLLEERQHAVIQQLRRRYCRLAVVQLRNPALTVRVDERLLIDPAYALFGSHRPCSFCLGEDSTGLSDEALALTYKER